MQNSRHIALALTLGTLALHISDAETGNFHAVFAVITRIDDTSPRPEVTITDPHVLANLLLFFDGLLDNSEPDVAGAWEGKYQILFTLSSGEQLLVTTSHDDSDWSSGKGDKPLKPGFAAFLKSLISEDK